jgi:hypothetical protein
MKLVFSVQEAGFDQASEEIKDEILKAAAGAVDDAAQLAVTQGRANIASAGFPTRWQNALAYATDKGADPSSPSATIFDRIGFASVFETGKTIGGKPLLWLPIESNLGTGVKSPKKYGKKLVSVNVAGKPPLLFDASDRKRGPLFVGVSQVNIRKRFDLRRIFTEAAGQMGEFYQKRLDRVLE